MKEEKVDIWQVIAGSGEAAIAAVESLEQRFLAENGYPEILEKGFNNTTKDIVRKRMSKRGERLHICKKFEDSGLYRIFFVLRRGKRVIATSKSIDLQFTPLEVPGDGQG